MSRIELGLDTLGDVTASPDGKLLPPAQGMKFEAETLVEE